MIFFSEYGNMQMQHHWNKTMHIDIASVWEKLWEKPKVAITSKISCGNTDLHEQTSHCNFTFPWTSNSAKQKQTCRTWQLTWSMHMQQMHRAGGRNLFYGNRCGLELQMDVCIKNTHRCTSWTEFPLGVEVDKLTCLSHIPPPTCTRTRCYGNSSKWNKKKVFIYLVTSISRCATCTQWKKTLSLMLSWP